MIFTLEKGIASIERTQDSVEFYIRLIDQVQTTDPIKNYYKSALDYSHSYSLENIEETGRSGFSMLNWASKTNEACFIADSYECIALYYREISMTDSDIILNWLLKPQVTLVMPIGFKVSSLIILTYLLSKAKR
ncbi:MAG: hypothetical protein IPG07_20670 [Crocinitomicaceae bacterium]|nr:hypothetical protein [Crocinitomicaceae bacterium]